jgi:hypothetical protein
MCSEFKANPRNAQCNWISPPDCRGVNHNMLARLSQAKTRQLQIIPPVFIDKSRAPFHRQIAHW